MAYGETERASAPVKKQSRLTLESRKKLTVTGVEEVENFDDREISMRTGEGMLTVRGEEMRIDALSVEGGDVNVQGRISELLYADPASERSFWARLFG